MIQIQIKTSAGKVYCTCPLSSFPPGWTFRDLKTWLDLLREHTKVGELRAYWKVTKEASAQMKEGVSA